MTLRRVHKLSGFRRPGQTYLDYLMLAHVKAAVALWGVLYILYTPPPIRTHLGPALVVFSGLFAIVGSITGIIGLTLTGSQHKKHSAQGAILEMSGLIVAACGPLTYFVTSAYLVVSLNQSFRHIEAGLAYALFSAIVARIIAVKKYTQRGAP